MFFKLGIRPEQLPAVSSHMEKQIKWLCISRWLSGQRKSLICIKSSGNWQQCHFIKTYRNRLLQDINGSIKELLEKFMITPKLLKIPNVSLQNVIWTNFKTYYTNSLENDMQLLTLANEGLIRIYGNTNVLARARVEKRKLSMSWSLVVIF
jgi:hypothetical protein